MDKKYVLQAFDNNLKGRFDVLLKYYGDTLFQLPAIVVVEQVKDELGIIISEQSIYTLKKRQKKKMLGITAPLAPIGPVSMPTEFLDTLQASG
ncbi:hypothetical protein [Dyadobacter arcticus]|uniref:Uncharacterized protein n=1 Tax=Dyadobacter arcticus TaxID=1078754 RepID=A0ABX0UKI7_9BACT|nr:hypothetical protein [Dyadobacter arcticus]NIJ52524.1 hypothetical protein [Dyadobacter arcticus]